MARGLNGKAREVGERAERILSGMSLRDMAAQMLMVSFRTRQGSGAERTVENAPAEADGVTELNEALRACIRDGRYGGFLLFAENCRHIRQTMRLIRGLREANRGNPPMLFAIDQEGGRVNRLAFGTDGVGCMALAAAGDPGSAREMAEIHGRELRLLGIHADFAPVMDIQDNPANPVIGVRAFSDDAETTAEYGRAFLEGLHDAGILAAAKHFPGHGNTDVDSHTGFPCIRADERRLEAHELVPFRAAIAAGADMIMTAHIRYPLIEKETRLSAATGERVTLPATMSRTILTDLLRGRMGFGGVIVSDALNMAAVAEHFETDDAVSLAIGAGVDMLILPSVRTEADYLRTRDMPDRIVRLAQAGRIDAARVRESARRILLMKARAGIPDEEEEAFAARLRAAEAGVCSRANRDAARRIAGRALTLVKNENGAFPLRPADGEHAVILFSESCADRAGAGLLAVRRLRERGHVPEGASIECLAHARENGEACLEAAVSAEHAVLVNRLQDARSLDPRTEAGASSALFDRILRARHARGKTAVLVSCGVPYDAGRFAEVDAILAAYCSGPMPRIPPEDGEGSGACPNLPEALLCCFGCGTAPGRLPVSLPAMDGEYRFTEEILWPRGTGEESGAPSE